MARSRPGRAFTLVELLVAVALFLLLGLMLANIVQESIHTWHYTESQSRLHARAMQVFSQVRHDLESLYLPRDDKGLTAPFLLDYDATGRQRLYFVRRLFPESRHPVLRTTGNGPVSAGYTALYQEPLTPGQKIRATGGLGEIRYWLVPRADGNELWRSLLAPPGYADKNLLGSAGYKLADRMLFFGLKCSHDPLQSPSYLWDASARQLPEFALYNHNDIVLPVYPWKVQIILLLAGQYSPVAVLAEEITSDQTEIVLHQPRFLNETSVEHANTEKQILMIASECIAFTAYQGRTLREVSRGIWGSKAKKHPAGTAVLGGLTFSTTVFVPAGEKK